MRLCSSNEKSLKVPQTSDDNIYMIEFYNWNLFKRRASTTVTMEFR